jgi:hypothetical protein
LISAFHFGRLIGLLIRLLRDRLIVLRRTHNCVVSRWRGVRPGLFGSVHGAKASFSRRESMRRFMLDQ